MEEIIESIKIQLPENSIRISNILQQLLEEIELVVEHFILEGYMPEKLDDIYGEISNIKEEMGLGFGQLNLLEETTGTNISEHEKNNLREYELDTQVEHTLLENFTYIKPFGFKFLNDETIKARNWNELYIKACQLFLKIDKSTFLTFINKTNMNGQSKNYFSENEEDMERPIKLMEKLYIETDFSANQFRDLLIKIIKEYNFDAIDFKMFFRADYKARNAPQNYISIDDI